MRLYLIQCSVGSPPGAETMRAILEVSLKYRLENQHDCHLGDAITYARDSEWTLFSVRLGYVDASHRLWFVASAP